MYSFSDDPSGTDRKTGMGYLVNPLYFALALMDRIGESPSERLCSGSILLNLKRLNLTGLFVQIISFKIICLVNALISSHC